jgi:hypothetical protein
MTVKVFYYCSLFCFLYPFCYLHLCSPSVCCFVSECA